MVEVDYRIRWAKKNPDKVRTIKKKYNEKHKEKLKLIYKKYRDEHREERNKQKRDWYIKNKKLCLEYAQKYAEANQEHKKKYMKEWARKNYNNIKKREMERYPEKVIARKITNNKLRKIPIGTICEICKENPAVHKHHLDYSNPFLIKFVCRKCHNELHRKN